MTTPDGAIPPDPPVPVVLPPRPLIDDAYWFEVSKKLVDGVAESRMGAAAKLQTMVGWFWTVYTTTAAIGLTLAKLRLPCGVTLLVALPSIFLLIGYWLAVRAQVPAVESFDPRSPKQIAKAHGDGVKVLEGRLRVASGFAGVGAVSVAVALFAVAMNRSEVEPSFQGRIDRSGSVPTLFVTGRAAPTVAVEVIASARVKAAKDGAPTIVMGAAQTSDSGEFGVAMALPKEATSTSISVSWANGTDSRMSLTKEISDGTTSQVLKSIPSEPGQDAEKPQ